MRFPLRRFLAGGAALASVALLMPTSGILLGSFAAECSALNCGAGQAISFRQGPYFNHALPAGWLVMEESNTMLLLQARDQSADISVTGIGGLKQLLTPEVFAFQRMAALRLTDVRFTSVVYIIPMAAYDGAAVMDVTYTAPIGRMRGLVVSNVATVYNRNVFDRTDGVMVLVGAKEPVWDAYSSWLPDVALQAVHTGPILLMHLGVRLSAPIKSIKWCQCIAIGRSGPGTSSWPIGPRVSSRRAQSLYCAGCLSSLPRIRGESEVAQ